MRLNGFIFFADGRSFDASSRSRLRGGAGAGGTAGELAPAQLRDGRQ